MLHGSFFERSRAVTHENLQTGIIRQNIRQLFGTPQRLCPSQRSLCLVFLGLEIHEIHRHEVVSLLIFTPLSSGVRFSREISIGRCSGKR